MEYIKLGRTGLDVSRICLGCMSYGVPERGMAPWSLNEEQSRPLLKEHWSLGSTSLIRLMYTLTELAKKLSDVP